MSGISRGARLLVVVAHPDDETFGLGSLIADAAAKGADVTVCCATHGEAGELAPGGALGGRSLGELRDGELREAASVLGAREVVALDFGDSGMDGDAPPATLVGAPMAAVVEAVSAVIVRARPDVIVTLDPTGGDGHRDHMRIAGATIAAARDVAPHASVYAWCIVRSLLRRWLDEQRAVHPGTQHLDLEPATLGRPDDDITTVLHVRALRATREQAIACHRSQRSPYEGMSPALVDAFLDTDCLVRIEPPWSGGPIETCLTVREAPGP